MKKKFDDYKEVLQLVSEEKSGCRVIHHRRHMCLSPRYLGRIKTGIHDSLDAELGKYSDRLEAIPFAYSNLKLLQPLGNILDDSPYIQFDVQYDVVVFKVQIGDIVKCTVNKVANDHFSCLIHGHINLSISLAAIDFPASKLKDHEVMAKVTKIQSKHGLLALQGDLTQESLMTLKKTLSKSEVVAEVEEQDADTNQDSADLLTTSTQEEQSNHKKKKRKVKQEFVSPLESEVSVESHDLTDAPSAIPEISSNDSPKKKKKKKKNSLEEDEICDGHERPSTGLDSSFHLEENTPQRKGKKIKSLKGTLDVNENKEDLSNGSLGVNIKSERVDSLNESPNKETDCYYEVQKDVSYEGTPIHSSSTKKSKKKKKHKSEDSAFSPLGVQVKQELSFSPSSTQTALKSEKGDFDISNNPLGIKIKQEFISPPNSPRKKSKGQRLKGSSVSEVQHNSVGSNNNEHGSNTSLSGSLASDQTDLFEQDSVVSGSVNLSHSFGLDSKSDRDTPEALKSKLKKKNRTKKERVGEMDQDFTPSSSHTPVIDSPLPSSALDQLSSSSEKTKKSHKKGKVSEGKNSSRVSLEGISFDVPKFDFTSPIRMGKKDKKRKIKQEIIESEGSLGDMLSRPTKAKKKKT